MSTAWGVEADNQKIQYDLHAFVTELDWPIMIDNITPQIWLTKELNLENIVTASYIMNRYTCKSTTAN